MKHIVLEFERVTKYPIVDFLRKYRDFMLNSYSEVDRYFSGETESIDNKHLVLLKTLTSDCKDVLAQFKNFSSKFSNCGFWELMDYIEDLNTTIEKVNNLPKFRRTSLTKRGYQPYIQADFTVGGYRTMEDVANEIKNSNGDDSWVDLMLSNDLNEKDWEIDELTPIKALINNNINVVVTTILDQPIGERIYGKDLFRKITFINNDILTVEYKDNIEQKCSILLELNRGDIPENMLFGKRVESGIGVTMKQYTYPELASDIRNNFMQNDLFEYAEVSDLKINSSNGTVDVKVDIKTKYDYKTRKNISI